MANKKQGKLYDYYCLMSISYEPSDGSFSITHISYRSFSTETKDVVCVVVVFADLLSFNRVR